VNTVRAGALGNDDRGDVVTMDIGTAPPMPGVGGATGIVATGAGGEGRLGAEVEVAAVAAECNAGRDVDGTKRPPGGCK